MSSISGDVLIVGAGLGGTAAALAAAEEGASVILTEPTMWIGGQLTSQAVPPDEHPWIEQFGATVSYRQLRSDIRDFYWRNYSLSARARESRLLNPGSGSVSALCHEPRVAREVLEQRLSPHRATGRVRLLLRHVPIAVERHGETVTALTFLDQEMQEMVHVTASFVLDASETGDILPLAQIPYVTGAESRSMTGEPHAPEEPRPQEMQGFTVCMALDHLDGEDHTIDRPAQYDYWRSENSPVRAAPQIGWPFPDPEHPHERTLRPNPDPESDEAIIVSSSATGRFNPPPDYKPVEDLWRFRRAKAVGNFDPPPESDITIMNWSANDYIDGSIVDVDPSVAARNVESARQLTLSVLYWLQTEAPRPDGGFGFRGLRPRGDIAGTDDGLAMAPYIREGRRIRALYTITEGDFAGSLRPAGAVEYFDSVGIGSYKMDLHPSTNGGERRYDSAWPFEIPLGALIPPGTTNFLAAAKNIGTTHLSNGCYRVHPVEWNIGESAGVLAAYCLRTRSTPAGVRGDTKLLRDYQAALGRRGVELHWPKITAY